MWTLSDFNEKLIEIFDTADSMREYNKVRDNIKQVILNDLIREDEERMQSMDVLDENTLYNTSFSLNATLKHDQHPDILYAFKAKTSPNIFDKDEITLLKQRKLSKNGHY